MSFSLIVGLYFILSGLGRFVEEAYRGEVQTKIVGGGHAHLSVAGPAVNIHRHGVEVLDN